MDKKVELYHGSGQIVEFPEVRKTRYTKDFSWGFYCTKSYEQAYRWAERKHKHGIINVYSYTENKQLKIKKFDQMCDEWLDFIAECRVGKIHDWFILLVAKTGMRFSEALAITPSDFDFARQTLSISKTWDYKGNGGFLPTKNNSSVRKIQIDWQIVVKFSELTKNLPEDKPIFVGETKIYNSTVNDVLTRHCKACGISEISIHGLRHTHASLLLFAGVSIASVARRLGHASMTTTQKTYLHIIQELENKDVDLVMRTLSGL